MLTIHAADLLLTAVPGADPVPGGAVVVDGGTVAALGPFEELAAAHPGARVRRWPGVLAPGLRQGRAAWLLEHAYHPDPREYAELGDAMLTGDRLAELELPETRRSGSVRRGLQLMLRHGTTAVVGPFGDPVISTAVARSGLRVVPGPAAPGEPDLDPLRGVREVAEAVAAPLAVGARADLAAFDVPDGAGLRARGAGSCVATVLAGRLVFRGR